MCMCLCLLCVCVCVCIVCVCVCICTYVTTTMFWMRRLMNERRVQVVGWGGGGVIKCVRGHTQSCMERLQWTRSLGVPFLFSVLMMA